MLKVFLYLATSQCFLTLISAGCHVLGPIFPAFSLSARDRALKPLLSELNVIAKKLASSPEYVNVLQPNKTSFSVQVTSAEGTLWAYHHTAELQGNYSNTLTAKVTGDTAFRIGSVSKVFTVLALLLQANSDVQFDDPITKYLPELLDDESTVSVAWKNITLRSLGSQLSGIQREYGAFDMTTLGPSTAEAIQAGLPPVTAEEIFPCGNHTPAAICSRKEYLRGLRKSSATYAPNYQSSYSNDAYVLLGLALEKITGKSYKNAMNDIIFTPLGMSRSSVTKPVDSDGIIPAVENYWRWNSGIMASTGGIFSTTNDLTLFLRSILKSRQLSEAQTNAWLKPQSLSPGLNSAFGMPWEISRVTNTTVDGRVIDIYGKGGGLPGYFSHIGLIPEYEIGVSILTAGLPAAAGIASERITAAVLRGVEKVVQEKSRRTYTGLYRAANLNSSIEIAMSDEGLYVKSWISNGTDFLMIFPKLAGLPPLTNDETLNNRRVLFLPTSTKASENVETWRVLLTPSSMEGIFSDYCFQNANMFQYGGHPINEVYFQEKEGKVYSVEFPALRITMVKMPTSFVNEYLYEPLQVMFKGFRGWKF